MNIIDLKDPIESQHGGIATHVQSVPVKGTFHGQMVWDGIASRLRHSQARANRANLNAS